MKPQLTIQREWELLQAQSIFLYLDKNSTDGLKTSIFQELNII